MYVHGVDIVGTTADTATSTSQFKGGLKIRDLKHCILVDPTRDEPRRSMTLHARGFSEVADSSGATHVKGPLLLGGKYGLLSLGREA